MASRRGKKRDPKLLDSEEGDEDNGIVNPMLEEDGEQGLGAESSAAETDEERLEADALVKDMKKKRRRKKKELGEDLISPKDDIGGELRTTKLRTKEKLEEESRREEPEVGDDGVVPMGPEDEEEQVVTFREPEEEEPPEESEVKKLRRRQKSAEQEGRESPVERLDVTAETSTPVEPEPAPLEPSLDESIGKTPRGSSLREKLRSRRMRAQEEVVDEVKKEAREERGRQLKEMRKKQASTRFDMDLDPEELERKTEEKQRQYRLRRSKLRQDKEQPGIYMPTPDEQYDFFTRNFEPDPEEPKPEVVEKSKTEKKEGEEAKPETSEEPAEGTGEEPTAGPSEEPTEGTGEEAKEEGAEEAEEEIKTDETTPLLGEEEISGLTVIRKAEYPDPDELQKKLDEILFFPSTASVPETEKVFDQSQPRFLEDEGFYVGTKPQISTRSRNKMEHRLLKQPDDMGRKWFGEDGRMLALPDPLRPSPWRPLIPEEPDTNLETVYHKALLHDYDNQYIDGSLVGEGNYQLDIDINSIVFSHHHLFSREHVLATRLTQLYDQYLIRKKRNMSEYLTEKLRALKSSYLHLQEHITTHRSDHSLADRANYARRLADYKSEIRETRVDRDKQEKTDRTLLKHIIHTWKEIKSQRELQKFINTAVKLQVTREEVDKTQDTFIWKTEIEDEVEEAREQHEEENQKREALYQEELAKWQAEQEAKKAAKSQKKRRGSRQSSASQPEAEQDAEKDEATDENMPKLEHLDPFDENVVREKMKAKAMEIRRRPGEPKLHLELTNTMSISATTQCPGLEQMRRENISKVKFFVKVLFNNKEVSRTASKPLSQEFKVTFGTIFNLKIASWPESIKFQLFEVIGLGSQLTAELYTPVPEMSITTQSVRLEDMEFSSDYKVNHTHAGVGSGFPFTFESKSAKDTETLILMTTGTLSCSAAWALDENGQPLVPPTSTTAMSNIFNAMKKLDPLADIGAAGVMDIKKLSEWFSQSRLDPNDPKNAELVFMLKPKGTDFGILEPADYFRLEPLQEEFNFTTDEEMNSNKRFKLLEYRDREVEEFRNYKMVPLYEREIARDAFTEYEKKQREQERIPDTDDIESYRYAVNHFLQKMREQVMQKFRHLYHQKKFKDMVLEEDVPNIAIIGTNIMKVFARRQPLKPKRKKIKTISPKVVKPGEVHVLVNVSRVTNVPLRSATSVQGGMMTSRGGETERKGGKGLVDVMVRPYVEVVFQHNVMRTSIGDGTNPSFNEELRIPFRAPNDDYKASSLQTVKDNIFINLFDEVVVDIQEDDRLRESSVHQRIEKKWLGGLTIPFSTVYFNGKIDGTFCLNVPPILLGYSRGDELAESDVPASRDTNTYLSLFLTIEPKLPAAESVKERSFTTEDSKLLDYADKWQNALAQSFPERDYKATVIDMNGRAIFITRYIKPLKPPEELMGKGTPMETMELVARYVAMIPFVSDSVLMPGLCDIWSTCDEFLRMLAGDEEEHAVLLLNYFLSMEKKAWLVIGTAIPEGPTAYVLTYEETDGYQIWNPSSGKHYSAKDSFCPLQKIGCLVNSENIWGNIQRLDMPSQMVFDVSMSSCWTPFFTRSFPSPGLGSVQTEALTYVPTLQSEVAELQERIETTLKTKIQDWRRHHLTRWHRHFTKIMRKMLPLLEENLGKPLEQQKVVELEQAFQSYKVSGFPINMPFTELASIEETVFSKGVHAYESSDIEFALAVHIHPFPNRVLSVWIYVASLIRLG